MKYVAFIGMTLALLGLGYVLANPPQKAQDETAPSQATVAVHVFNHDGKLVGPVESPKVEMSAADWRKKLSPEAFDVLRNQGTERAGSGALLDTKDDGRLHLCRLWLAPVFIRCEISFWHRLAELFSTDHPGKCGGALGPQRRHGAHRDSLPSMRRPFGPCVRGWTEADRLAILPRLPWRLTFTARRQTRFAGHDPAAERRSRKPGRQLSNRTQRSQSLDGGVLRRGVFGPPKAAAFDQIAKGVVHVESGYSGGVTKKPQITPQFAEAATPVMPSRCRSLTIQSRVSYDQLLDVFFAAR